MCVRAGQGGESEADSMLSVEPNTGLNQFWRISEQTASRITLAPMLKPDRTGGDSVIPEEREDGSTEGDEQMDSPWILKGRTSRVCCWIRGTTREQEELKRSPRCLD